MHSAEHSAALALVTGASSGIGLSFAHALARQGYDLALVGRDTRRLEALASDLPGRSHVLVADLTRERELGGVEVFLRDSPRRVDLLVNNAGAGWFGPFAAHDEELLAGTIDLNVTAAVRLTRAALPRMLAAGRGGVINVSSLASRFPQPSMATYAATKAFIDSWTRSLRAELVGSGVVVTCVRPSWVRSEFHARSGESVDHVKDRRWLSADEVASRALDAHARDQAFVAVPRDPPIVQRATWQAMGWLRRHAPDWLRNAYR